MTDDLGKRLQHQHPTLIQVADWLGNKGYSYEAATIREACVTIGCLVAEADRNKRIASKAINEGVADRRDTIEKCATIVENSLNAGCPPEKLPEMLRELI
jgi:hypothetical protein